MGGEWRTKGHKPGFFFFKAQRIAGAIVSPLFTCHAFTWDMVCSGIMHCVDFGVSQEVLGNIFSEYLDKGACPVVPIRQGVKVCGANLQDRHQKHNATSQIPTLGVTKFK